MQEFPYRIGILLSSYSQAINKQNKTTGSLFQQKTKAKDLYEQIGDIKENYLINCFNYLHRNPLKCNLVNELNNWPYSSYLDYIGNRNGTLCDKDHFILQTGMTKDEIVSGAQSEYDVEIIKKFYVL